MTRLPCRMWVTPVAAALLVAAAVTGPSYAESQKSAGALSGDLAEVRDNLEALKRDIASHIDRRDKVSKDIEKADRDINATLIRKRETNSRLEEIKADLVQLQSDLDSSRNELKANATAIESLIRNVHSRGYQPELKVLLGDVDPVRVGRSLVWYRYVANARTEAIEAIRNQINQHKATQAKISNREREQQDLLERLDEDARYLKQRKQNKATMLASINSDLTASRVRAESLREAEELLSREIDAIAKRARLEQEQKERDEAERKRRAAAAAPATKPKRSAPGTFKNSRGTLPFPAEGEIGARFGDSKGPQGQQTWKGILIHADEGEPVRAVADGVVEAVANRPPYGPTIFLVHNDGFVTAYLHNSEVLKARGDRVSAGEVIARVGSFGLDRPGLYFLIRDAQVGYLDPLQWLNAR